MLYYEDMPSEPWALHALESKMRTKAHNTADALSAFAESHRMHEV